MPLSRYLAEKLYARVLPHRTLILRCNSTKLLAFDVISQIEELAIVGNLHGYLRASRKLLRPIDLIDREAHGEERIKN
jgi:hypothetical protein